MIINNNNNNNNNDNDNDNDNNNNILFLLLLLLSSCLIRSGLLRQISAALKNKKLGRDFKSCGPSLTRRRE